MDTIFALSSGSLPAGVAVVRVSGSLTGSVLTGMVGALPSPGRLVLRNVRDPGTGLVLDRGLVVWNPAPGSFTGEDVCEFQLHGSRAVLRRLIDSLRKQGLREARPGEFIRRAFDAGKLDLTEVEGVADLVAAETEAQRRQAVEHAGGALREACASWRETLIRLRAEVEAQLDFSDEGDVQAEVSEAFAKELSSLQDELRRAVSGVVAGEAVREGFQVAIVGRPNAGKSSLLNALANRDVAIVTDEPGTTRDLLEVRLDLDGYPVRLFDTAGLRESDSVAEQEGVRRAYGVMQAADLVLWLEDCTQAPETEFVADIVEDGLVLRISSKIDLAGDKLHGAAVSSKTGEGVSELLAIITRAAAEAIGSEPALLTRERHRAAIESALSELESVSGARAEVAAHLLRSASEAIGRLSGRVDVEDVLDRLFGEFCIGK